MKIETLLCLGSSVNNYGLICSSTFLGSIFVKAGMNHFNVAHIFS